jgi:hypothetical protein
MAITPYSLLNDAYLHTQTGQKYRIVIVLLSITKMLN